MLQSLQSIWEMCAPGKQWTCSVPGSFFFFYSYFTQVYSAQLPATREKKMVCFVFYCVCNEMQLDFCYWLVKSDLVHTALKIHTIMHFLVDVCQSAHPRWSMNHVFLGAGECGRQKNTREGGWNWRSMCFASTACLSVGSLEKLLLGLPTQVCVCACACQGICQSYRLSRLSVVVPVLVESNWVLRVIDELISGRIESSAH